MKYVHAKDILPENILKQLQTYAAGTLLYVPNDGEEKSKAPSETYLSAGGFFGGRVCGMWTVRRRGAYIFAF